MAIDELAFTPLQSLVGGVLIGSAAVLLLVLLGRIAGISGIVGGLLKWRPDELGWRLAFVFGIALAPVLFGLIASPPSVEISAGNPLLIVAGLLVGFGARLGSGCTSGHGVCGLARLSRRSLVATLVFMATAFLTQFLR